MKIIPITKKFAYIQAILGNQRQANGKPDSYPIITVPLNTRPSKILIASAIILLGMAQRSLAQDIIIQKDGSEIKSKVIEVGQDEIRYYSFGSTSPIRIIPKATVFMIRYENGSKDIFQDDTKSIVQRKEEQSKINLASSDEIKKTQNASLAGYLLPIPIMALGIAASSADDSDTGVPLGASATLIAGVGIPLVAMQSRKLRKLTGVNGNTGLRTAGWIAYGLAIGDALVLISLASENDIPPSTTISVALLGSLASILMGLDAAETATQASVKTTAKRIVPVLGATQDFVGSTYQTLGLRIRL